MDAINQFVKRTKLTGTKLQRKMMDFALADQGIDNYTTLEDTVSLLEKVYRKELVSQQASDWFMDVLHKQRDRKMLGRFLPESVPFSNKTGLNKGIQHDIGFFNVKDTTYMLGVFLEGVSDEVEGFEFIGKLAKQVYEEVENA
jgi:beta-lactamase class A